MRCVFDHEILHDEVSAARRPGGRRAFLVHDRRRFLWYFEVLDDTLDRVEIQLDLCEYPIRAA